MSIVGAVLIRLRYMRPQSREHLQVVSLLGNGADSNSRGHFGRVLLHSVLQGEQLVITKSLIITRDRVSSILVHMLMSPTMKAGPRSMRQRNLDIVRLRNCYLDPVEVSMLGMRSNRNRWNSPVSMGSLTWQLPYYIDRGSDISASVHQFLRRARLTHQQLLVSRLVISPHN